MQFRGLIWRSIGPSQTARRSFIGSEPPTSRILVTRASHNDVQVALPGHRLFTANDRESTDIARFSPEVRHNQTRCLAVENEHQADLLEPMVR